MKGKENKQRPIPPKIIERAKVLFLRGHSIKNICLKLGFSEMTFSRYRDKGDWDNEILPVFNLSDLLEDSREILFEYFQCVLSGKEDDFQRAAINLQKLTRCVIDLEEIREKAGIRDEIIACQNIINWLVENPKEDPIKAIQEYHDMRLKEM